MLQQFDHQFRHLQKIFVLFPSSTSVHFRSRNGIDTEDNVEFDVCCGLVFATSFTKFFSPILSTNLSQHLRYVSVDSTHDPRKCSVHHVAVEHRRVNVCRVPKVLCVLMKLSEKVRWVRVSSAAENET